MVRRTMVFKVREGVPAEKVAKLEELVRATPKNIPGIARNSLGRDLNPRKQYSHVWDMDFTGPEAVQGYAPHPYHMNTLVPFFNAKSPTNIVEALDYAYYQPLASGARPSARGSLIRRVMFFQLSPSASLEQANAVESLLKELPKKVPSIVNWSLDRTTRDRMPKLWTHVWELEFADQAGLDLYSKDLFHLNVVAPYFRPDSPKRAVEQISVAWYRADAPLITPD